MSIRTRSFWAIVSFVCSGGVSLAQSKIENWPAPASWSPSSRVVSKGEVSPSAADESSVKDRPAARARFDAPPGPGAAAANGDPFFFSPAKRSPAAATVARQAATIVVARSGFIPSRVRFRPPLGFRLTIGPEVS